MKKIHQPINFPFNTNLVNIYKHNNFYKKIIKINYTNFFS